MSAPSQSPSFDLTSLGGPLVIEGLFDVELPVSILNAADETEVAEIFPSSGVNFDEWSREEIARVKAMAAAPELLYACRLVLKFFDGLEENTELGDPLREMRRKVHAPLRAALEPAIRKAEGRSEPNSPITPDAQASPDGEAPQAEKETTAEIPETVL